VEKRFWLASRRQSEAARDVRCCDDDLGVDELLIELGVFAFLVRCCYEGVALVFEPFANTQLVLGRAYSIRVRRAFDLDGHPSEFLPSSSGTSWACLPPIIIC
jgi:hypothetical protein